MAKLSLLAADTSAEEGEWVSPGLEFDDVEIRSRGYTDAYQDTRNAKLFRAAKAYGGDASRIPSAIQRRLMGEALIQHVTLDVRNLQHEDGREVTFEELKAMVFEARYRPLLDACYAAANIVQARREADVETAAPLSAPPSA